MIPLVGYTDRFSAAPGEKIHVKVSSSLAAPYHADLVRIRSADPNPDGPGMRLEPVQCDFAGEYPSRPQAVQSGSCGVIAGRTLTLGHSWTASLRVQPWLLDEAQTVLSLGTGPRAELRVSRQGCEVRVGQARCQVPAEMIERQWYELRLFVSGTTLRVMQLPLEQACTAGTVRAAPADIGAGTAEMHLSEAITHLSELVLAAAPGALPGQYTGHFNGRLEHPCFLAGIHDAAELLDPAAIPRPALLAWWDFSLDIDSLAITDRGPYSWHGTMRNLPTRGVRGPSWTGNAMRWKDGPDEYAAAHFHADDLYDCAWQDDFVMEVPAGLPSGVYGIRLREHPDSASGAEDVIPVFVRRDKAVPAPRVAVVMSTYTYQIYANYDRHNFDDAFRARVAQWNAYPHHPAENKQFGLSCYDHHADGSGVAFSSARRPILTMRPGALAYVDPRGSGIRHFAADMHLLSWLDAKGIEYDVITDDYIEHAGLAALEPYAVVMTGSHPEYQTLATLDAHRDYVACGGRLIYLGGNGFYWRIARSDKVPGMLEVRRAENGVRSWVAPPGEYYHALDGCYGGLWRNQGRAPQALLGIGFCAQGKFEGSYYRRLPASYRPEYEWVFRGIESDEILGDFGFSGGGAAGFELDRVEPLLGSPANTTVLCRSEGHSSTFGATLEELIAPPAYKQGDKAAALVRADMAHYENSRGGAVFSVGSITFCGSLPWNNYDNSISTLLKNVVDHFSATPARSNPDSRLQAP